MRSVPFFTPRSLGLEQAKERNFQEEEDEKFSGKRNRQPGPSPVGPVRSNNFKKRKYVCVSFELRSKYVDFNYEESPKGPTSIRISRFPAVIQRHVSKTALFHL